VYDLHNKLEVLREHKPPPNTAIRRIRISDFGLPDPKRDHLYHLVLEPRPTPTKNIVKIRSQVCK